MRSEQQYSTVDISDIGYCFSPFIVKVEASSGITGMEISVLQKENTKYNERLQFNGEKEIRKDIGNVMKSIFDYNGMIWPINDYMIVENSSKQYDIAITVNTKNGSSTHNFENITFVYGALDYGKIYYTINKIKNVRHFVNFPFGLDFLLSPGAYLSFSLKPSKEYTGEYKNIVYEIMHKPDLATGKKYQAYIGKGGVELNTIRYPFIDNNNIFDTASDTYFVTVDNCTEGVYLMWLNREGMRSFFLFKNKGVNTSIEGEEYNKKLNYNTGYIENPKQINKKAKKTITLAVPMSDKEEYSYIESVLTSPEVYMYNIDSALFTKVNVVTGDFERTGAELQDFTFQIELPEEYTIKL